MNSVAHIVAFSIRSCERQRRFRRIDANHFLRAAADESSQTETAGVTEQVEYAMPLHVTRDGSAVLSLVEIKSRLMSLTHIDTMSDADFFDVKWSRRFASG